jgi:spore germination protein KC
MVGQIDDSVTRGVLWLRNEIQLAIITVHPKKAKGYVSMNLLHANSKLIPKIEDGKWKITLKTESTIDIIQNTTNLDMSNPVVVKMLEQQVEKQSKNRVKTALDKVQKEMNADIFGFADAFHRAYPEIWKKEKNRWDEIFPQIK